MNFIFIIQGEGRGHMTQAIALSKMLKKYDHNLSKVIVGMNPSQSIPDYFKSKIGAPVIQFESPKFSTDNKQKSINLAMTFFQILFRSKRYLKNIKFLSEIITYENPDVIINFYDFLAGIYNFWFRPKLKFICIGHQYLISHPEFTFPNKKIMSRVIFKLANQITRLRAAKVLALSFQYFKNNMTNNFIVTPPLLREELLGLNIKTEDYFLIYIVNSGYGEEIEFFHRKNPNIPLICFWDNKEKPKRYMVSENLIFYQLNDQLFLKKMAACKGFVTTAGFESVCESIYLGKPTLMIPVEGHYEQECNALDAFKAGAGIKRSNFDLTPLINYIPKYKNLKNEFHRWVAQGEHIFMKNLT